MKSQNEMLIIVCLSSWFFGCQPSEFKIDDPKNLASSVRSAEDIINPVSMPTPCTVEQSQTGGTNPGSGTSSGTRTANSCLRPSSIGGTIDSMDVHVLQDLRGLYGQYGCDIWDPMSLECRKSAFQYCQAKGYLGGIGPSEWEKSVARINCVPNSAGSYMRFGYNGDCNASNPRSIWCQSITRRLCIARGFSTSTGVIDFSNEGITTLCLKGPEIYDLVSFSSIAELIAPSNDKSCSRESIIQGKGCQHAVHRFCISKGYSTGFDVLELNSSESGIVSCAKTKFVETGMAKSPTIDGYERPAIIGSMIVGGAAFAHDITYADAVVNKFSFPIVVSSLNPISSFMGNTFSKDSCFYLNRGAIYQFDDSDDGEIACVYSEEQVSPSIKFAAQSGILLKPGERLIFQGTPQWGAGGVGLYAGAKITIAREGLGNVGLRRVRFPRWDTAYKVPGGNNPVTIGAGCDKPGCGPNPIAVPPGKPLQNSNSWQVMDKATKIRGVNLFLSSAQVKGLQRFKGCLKVVQQGGSELRAPWCFDITDSNMGPSTFNKVFGSQQNGSSYVSLDIDVPAGALVGLEFTLISEDEGGLDLAAYVFFEK
ncbi:MAG: hypothetical protein RJB66_1193 [Pseudomonadota bacterium]